jgi:hypothetical protein
MLHGSSDRCSGALPHTVVFSNQDRLLYVKQHIDLLISIAVSNCMIDAARRRVTCSAVLNARL